MGFFARPFVWAAIVVVEGRRHPSAAARVFGVSVGGAVVTLSAASLYVMSVSRGDRGVYHIETYRFWLL